MKHLRIKISKIKSFILFLNIAIIVTKISIHIIIEKSIDNLNRDPALSNLKKPISVFTDICPKVPRK
jgi:hypothetical protein